MGVIAEILMIGDPEWMAKKENLARMLEYYLYEGLRKGMAMHLMRETPCVAIDLEKLLTLFQYALGTPKIYKCACNKKYACKYSNVII